MQPNRIRSLGRRALVGVALLGPVALPAAAQQVDCARLQQLVAQGGRGGRGGGTMRRQAAEIARAQAMVRQNGCDGFTIFGGNPNCTALTQRLQALQAGMAQLQAGGGGDRGDLVARYNAYCRGGQPTAQPQTRGFFESLFGGGEERRPPVPQMPPPEAQGPRQPDADDEDGDARGGSQAVCVRTCDGGFFPLGISARHGKDSLVEMCQALCPGTETAVYTRSPDADIKTAASLDGKPYTELPNALKFEKSFSNACTCRQAGKSWAETLANAEEVLGATRKGDIVVTKEKSDELSRPRSDPEAAAAMLAKGQAVAGAPAKASPADAAKLAGAAADNDPASPPDADGPRGVRRVGPRP